MLGKAKVDKKRFTNPTWNEKPFRIKSLNIKFPGVFFKY
jgi:hypothetical protein